MFYVNPAEIFPMNTNNKEPYGIDKAFIHVLLKRETGDYCAIYAHDRKNAYFCDAGRAFSCSAKYKTFIN